MAGCLDNCYLFLEDESIEHLSPEDQIKLEKELRKSKNGEEFDPSLILQINKKSCLGGYSKNKKLKKSCKHYWECLEELSIEKRMEIFNFKEDKKWKQMTLSVTIILTLVSIFFAYLNFSKPTYIELKSRTKLLEKEIINYELIIENQKKEIIQIKQGLEDEDE